MIKLFLLIYCLISIIVYILTLYLIDDVKEIGSKIRNMDYKSLPVYLGILLIIGIAVYIIALIPTAIIYKIFNVIESMINKIIK